MDSGVDISELKSLAWNGIPDELRPIVWQLLLVRAEVADRASTCTLIYVPLAPGIPPAPFGAAQDNAFPETTRVP